MKKHYRHEHDCLNCGTGLQGKFCHNCGQENLEIKESFGHMVNHAVSDYFHFDHQFFHTLKPLLFKPGQLTIEYMRGRRAQYLHPVKMYIFISLVYFLLIFKSNHEVVRVDNKSDDKTKKEAVGKAVHNAVAGNHELSPAQKKKLEDKIKKNLPSAIAKNVKVEDMDDDAGLFKLNTSNDKDEKGDSTLAGYNLTQQKLPADERDGFWERFYHKTSLTYKEKYGERGPEMFKEDVKHNFPKMMFVLLPLFALILKWTFWRNHKFYVEHMIYSIHLHCFFFLFMAIILVIQLILPHSWEEVSNWLNAILFFYTLYYIYRSLRVLYNRSRWVTIWKMLSMSVMYWVVFAACAMGLIMITAASMTT
jgi:hypothetical protein